MAVEKAGELKGMVVVRGNELDKMIIKQNEI